MTSHQKPAARNQKPEAKGRFFIIPVFIPHAGCPHRCVFCDQASITGMPSEPIRQNDIRDQIEAFLKYKKVRCQKIQIAFFGGNFLGLPPDEIERLLAIAAEYVKSGRVNGIRFSTRPDTIGSKRLELIKKFPVATIELGVQSMDEKVLKRINRGHSAVDTQKAIQNLKKFDYEIGVQLMVGLPGDTPRRLIASAQQVVGLKPDFIRIYPTLVLKGSPLGAWYRKGNYVPLSIEEAVSQSKNLYLLFKSENIRVIRMGLQATEDLQNGATVLAGPFHPAFGHLVYSEIFLDMAVEQIESTALNTDSISIRVNPINVSKLRGLRNRNISRLKKKFGFESVAVKSDDNLAPDQLMVDRLT